MASPDVTQALADLPQNKPSGFDELLQKILSTSRPEQLASDLIAFLDSILGDSLGIVAARPLLGSYVTSLKNIQSLETKVQVGQHALEAMQPRVASFEEQDAMVREILADAYTEQDEFREAAKVLQGIQLDSSQRKISASEKFKTYIRICRLYLEEDDTMSAESYLNRAKNLLHEVDDKELNLMFQLSQARILDARRRFLDASQAYHKFSFAPMLHEDERIQSLTSAIICAILDGAGPQRSRMLAKLYKDERAAQVEDYGILEKVYLDRLLSPGEVSKFAAKLPAHQLAQTADGFTVLAKAMIEHNLLATSRLYSNIGVEELGILLGLNAEKAEEYAARMLEQGRLTGRIDQIDNIIYFDGRQGTGEKTNPGQMDRITGHNLRKWDNNVQKLAEDVERVTSLLQAQIPEFVATNLVQ